MSTRNTRSRGRGSSCTNPTEHQIPYELPDLAVTQVLKHIPDSDQCSTILNCRLVCIQWNQVIEDTYALMKKITFEIRDPKLFLDLPIVKKGKVKSIKMTKAWPLESRDNQQLTTDFTDTINKTVEKVEFTFKRPTADTNQQEIELFHLILKECENIQQFIVTELLFGTFTQAEIEIKSADKIRSVFFKRERRCFGSYEETEAIGMITLLLKLPKLKEIKFDGKWESEIMVKIWEGLLEYLNKFGHALQLKELTLPLSSFLIYKGDRNILNALLVQCGKYSVVLDGLPCLDFNSLLAFPELSSPAVLNPQQPIFYGKVNGEFTFKLDSVFSNLDILGNLDIRRLHLYYTREIVPAEFGWITNLKNLELLCFFKYGGLQSIGELGFEQAFSAGLVSLKELKVFHDLFDSTCAMRWGVYFPNLTKLSISHLKNTTNDLIAELTVLESLTALKLSCLPNLNDLAFTSEHLCRISGLVSPAIGCFKSLIDLHINSCPKLTNACVIKGIAKSRTLEKLTIYTCKKMTNVVEQLVEFEVNYTDFYFGCLVAPYSKE